jgi:serine phosphatase RsbU (regulator of sigma subunit)
MRHLRLFSIGMTVLLAAAFNALWLLAPRLEPGHLWPSAFLINLALLLFMAAFVIRQMRQRRELGRLRRDCLRLELRAEDREREAHVLETINTVSASFLEHVGVRTLLGQMSDALHNILAVDATIIEVLPEAGTEAEPITLSSGADIRLGEEIHQEVLQRGKSILINDIGHYPRYAPLHRQGLTAMLVAPFKHADRVIGLIGAFTRSERAFSGRDLAVLHTFATHTTLLLESATLLDAVRRLSVRHAADEIADLRHLRSQLQVERDIADREAAVAQRIQAELLPKTFPHLLHVTLDGLTVPARDVGGDFFDVIPLDDSSWGIAVADVAGKGVPAALVMVMTRTLLRAIAPSRTSPREALLRLSRELYGQTTGDVFVSMFYGVWDDQARTLRYTNAGHEPPLLVHGASAEVLPRGGVALGAFEEIDQFLAERTVQLDPHDALVLYTDGVREAMDERQRMYGIERLLDSARHAVATARPLVAALRSGVSAHVDAAHQHDDITLLTLQAH